jgi:hypothetical protein
MNIISITLLIIAVNQADAQTLSCNVGASLDLEGKVSACTVSDKRYKDGNPFDGPSGTTCEGDKYSCLTGNWASNFKTAYGCFGGGDAGSWGVNQIEKAKIKIIAACKTSPTCLKNNPGGVPVGGWTACNTTNCSPRADGSKFNSAGVIAPSLLVGLSALLLAFVSKM